MGERIGFGHYLSIRNRGSVGCVFVLQWHGWCWGSGWVGRVGVLDRVWEGGVIFVCVMSLDSLSR